MTYNIVGDVAGRFTELMLLLAKMPAADKTILLGDMMDRGDQSKQVIEWAMNNPDVIAIKGNHEDMMIDFWENTKRYEEGIWVMNGGNTTIRSYDCLLYPGKPSNEHLIRDYIPKEHIEWLKNLPIFFKDFSDSDGLFVSHAPWNGSFALGNYKSEEDALWNRYKPHDHEGVFQIFGHNSSLKQYGNHAICIDNSSKRVLTGIHWPTKQIFEVDYNV